MQTEQSFLSMEAVECGAWKTAFAKSLGNLTSGFSPGCKYVTAISIESSILQGARHSIRASRIADEGYNIDQPRQGP
jgi:hypothetical protein